MWMHKSDVFVVLGFDLGDKICLSGNKVQLYSLVTQIVGYMAEIRMIRTNFIM